MRYVVYEEFPNKGNLKKLSYLDFGFDMIVAAKSLDEFYELKDEIEPMNPNVRKVGYWPTLTIEEGYWFSPFSKRSGMERIISELVYRANTDERLWFKWDAEIPLVNNALFRTELPNFLSSKRMIEDFLKNYREYGLDLVIAQWPGFWMPDAIQKILGISFDSVEYDCDTVRMAYSSLTKSADRLLGRSRESISEFLFRREIRNGVRKYGGRFSIGIGCLATGIFGNEPLMTLEEFEHDLKIASQENVSSAFIFRLGGIEEEHARIMRKYL